MTGNSMKSDLLVESRSHLMSTNTADGRQPGHTNNNTNNNNTNNTNNNSQTIGISGTNTSSNTNTDSSRIIIMSHLRSSSTLETLENGDLRRIATSGIAHNNLRPDLTLAIQENLKYGVGLPSGFGCELLSRESRPHPAAATSSLSGVTEGNRGSSSSSISINNNTINTTNTTSTTNNNNTTTNNGVYANGSSSSGTILLPLPIITTGETRSNNNVTNKNTNNMTPSLYFAFTSPNNSTSVSSTSTSTSQTTTGSVTTLNRCNNSNHNGTTAQHTTRNLTSITNNITSLDHLSSSSTSGGCEDYSISNNNNNNNNIHSNNSPVFSLSNNTPNNTGGPVASPSTLVLPLSDLNYSKQVTTDFTNSSSSGSNRESKLKELILLHIDFIHHQQDLIVQKDKDISDLKSENETLKCRLDRMDRRLSILKQKGDPVNSHHPPPHSHHHPHHHHPHHLHPMPKPQASSDGTTTTTTTPGDRGSKKFNFLKRRERKFGVDAENVPKKKSSESGKSSSKSHSLTKSQLSYRSSSSSDSVNRCQELSDNGDLILRTDNLYYVSYYEPPFRSEKLLVNIRHTNDEINPDGSKVELPHWRLRPVANCYTLEGTENLEDEVFTKRHQKPELEEKRRKRWDLQRMREQKLFERLREKGKPYPDPMKDEPQYITSFYPSLDDITHIEIADKVPVMAFGHPIPYIKPTDFELPWELGEWPTMSSSSGDDTRHQKHRRLKRK